MEVNMYKRISVLLVLMMVISMTLAACGVEEGGEVVTSSKIEVPVYPGAQPGPDKLKPGLDQATEEFKSLSPGFNVESNLYLIPTATDDVYKFYNDALKDLGEGVKSQTSDGVAKFQWMTENQEVTVYHLPDPAGEENMLIVLNAWK
jgi:hypothetical protein